MKNVKILKKNGTLQPFDPQKVKNAIHKAAARVDHEISNEEMDALTEKVKKAASKHMNITKDGEKAVCVEDMHSVVMGVLSESGLEDVANSYGEYRYYKTNYAKTFEKLKAYADDILYRGDRENANFDSALISTKGSLLRGYLAKELYKQFFLSKREKELMNRGDIYLHDARDLIFGSYNCCLANFEEVMKGGFEAANIRYTEPKSVGTAISLLGDLVLMTSPMQFGGMTVPEIDKILLPYAKKTLKASEERYRRLNRFEEDEIEALAWEDLKKELRQGFQALELKLNSIASARGDYPFSTITFGAWNAIDNRTEDDDEILSAICNAILHQRIVGHGGLPVVFPKLVYLWDEDLINENERAAEVFDECVKCCAKRQYPDMLSLTGDPEHNSVAQQYLESGRKCVVSPMGCRAFLSPWKNEKGELIAVGRCNIGVVSLNIPLLVAIAKKENPEDFRNEFWKILADRMDVARDFLRKRYDYIAKQKASTNPIMFTQGGLYGGYRHPDESIGDLIRYMTASFGYIGLNEATILWEGETIREDQSFGLEVLNFIQNRINEYKKEDGHLYAFYSTPAESYQGTAVKQYEAYTGDKQFGDYFTNSFHMSVKEDITPFEKQDLEEDLFKIPAGGRIQYVRIDNPENLEAIRALLIRGLRKGFYQGINFDQVFCNDCGAESTNSLNKCPHCGSTNINVISRVTGYLGYTKVNGGSRMNDALLANVHDRVSM